MWQHLEVRLDTKRASHDFYSTTICFFPYTIHAIVPAALFLPKPGFNAPSCSLKSSFLDRLGVENLSAIPKSTVHALSNANLPAPPQQCGGKVNNSSVPRGEESNKPILPAMASGVDESRSRGCWERGDHLCLSCRFCYLNQQDERERGRKKCNESKSHALFSSRTSHKEI